MPLPEGRVGVGHIADVRFQVQKRIANTKAGQEGNGPPILFNEGANRDNFVCVPSTISNAQS
jgi:hypothetical protein